jgi:hypothetical protein
MEATFKLFSAAGDSTERKRNQPFLFGRHRIRQRGIYRSVYSFVGFQLLASAVIDMFVFSWLGCQKVSYPASYLLLYSSTLTSSSLISSYLVFRTVCI